MRGEIIPVMSVRLKLGLEDDVYTDKTRYIIVKVEKCYYRYNSRPGNGSSYSEQ